MANLTQKHVETIMPNAKANGLDKEWDTLLETLRVFEINSKNRIAAFLMNVAKESGELYYVEEIASGDAYEWRADLGNNQPGDGRKYKGHGYIQITGRNNHRAVGKALGVDFETNPLKLTQLPYTWLSAGWYWRYGSSWGNLNNYADKGDYKSTILGVRGGADYDREHYWWTAMDVLPDDVTLPNSEPEPEEPPETPDWPTRLAKVDDEGWLVDIQAAAFIRTPELKKIRGATDDDGWWYAEKTAPESEPSTWQWPIANEPPLSWGTYVQRHPTRYNFRPDVEKLVRKILDMFPGKVWPNTYYDHPEGLGRDVDSVDFWAYDGRGYAIDPSVGQQIFDYVWNDPTPPMLEWVIWQGVMYGAWNGWAGEAYGWDDFTLHMDHVHMTFRKA